MNPVLVAEFRGLFWGEGSVLITRKRLGGRGGWTYSPALTMDLAEKERMILLDIALHFGGNIGGPYKNSRSSNFRYRWRVDGFTQTPPIAKLLLEGALLPHPKTEQLKLLLDFCWFRSLLPGSHLDPKDKECLKTFFDQMKALRC